MAARATGIGRIRAELFAAVLVTVLALSGCTRSATGHLPPPVDPDLVGAEVISAVSATIDEINATAGGPVADQRAVLDRVVDPGEAAEQRDCPVARATLAFDPAYRDLRPAPDGGPDEYLLPAYITIYTGGRITGSDLATVRFFVTGSTARTAALCVS